MNDKDQKPAAITNTQDASLEGESITADERRSWSAPRLTILPVENTLGPSTFGSGQAAHVS
ncbi:hypothetical protein [Novosphingobium beihaiensis]|uniref:Uncharacterized protein n=1 Tax=Novosphingobium beihaiensis TaxID=2930389 RepID=A0ABT0BQY5_9SPHN|nr:hypothetical protein [Novosphingobium beihaiensis]MCJ2187064.1 hypothetical protein [Novosphingobium beihaiensis]